MVVEESGALGRTGGTRFWCLPTDYNSGAEKTANEEKSHQRKDNALAIKKSTHTNKHLLI